MTYTRKAVFGISAVLFMYGFGLIFGFLFRVLLTHKLSVAEYGLYYALTSFFAIVFLLRDLGMQNALAKFLPEWVVKKSYGEIKQAVVVTFVYTFLFSLIIIALSALFSNTIAENFFKQPGIESIILLFAVAFSLSTFDSIMSAIYVGFQKIVYYSIVGIARPAFLLICTYGFLFVFPNIKAPVIGLLLSSILTIFLWLPLIRFIPWSAPVRWSVVSVRKFVWFGAQIFLAGLGGSFLQYTDSLMLTYFKSVSDVGIYNAALPVSNIILYLGSAIATVTLPMFSELLARRMKVRVRNALVLLYKYTIVVALPAVAVMFTFSDLIVRILFGENYIAAALPLQILAWGVLLNILATINFTYFNAKGKPLLVTIIIGSAALANVIFNAILIPKYGIVGAAIGTSASFGVMLVVSAIAVHRYICVHSPAWEWFKSIICCIIMIGIIFWLKNLLVMQVYVESIVVVLVAGLSYLLLVFLFRIINIKEIKGLISQTLK